MMASPIALPTPIELPRTSGGILINGDAPTVVRGRPPAIVIRPVTAQPSPSESLPRGRTGSNANSNDGNVSIAGEGSSPRIRFAPLPDPHRPRSLSTGRNVRITHSEGPNGEREYSLSLQNMGDEHAIDDAETSDAYEGAADDGEAYDSNGRRKSWVTMGMNMGGWMGMKKGKKDEDFGVPLKKTVSGSSLPITAPKKSSSNLSSSLLGTSPGSSFAGTVPTHKRDGSTGDASLGTSAPKVRMLNGRVYGARRASEAAAAQEVRRREMEPAFVEWGSGQRAATRSSSNGFDDDDGGGMSWVRKRREERERREREAAEQASKAEAEAEAAAAANADADTANGGPDSLSSSASSMSPPLGPGPQTPHGPPAELVAFPPTINVVPPERKAENQHVVQAIAIPGAAARGRRRRSDDFDDDEDGDDDDGDFDDDDGEDDGDFENDDEDEAELAGRFTASAAGVEILSRHKK